MSAEKAGNSHSKASCNPYGPGKTVGMVPVVRVTQSPAAAYPHGPVLSALRQIVSNNDKQNSLDAGMNCHLSKPVDTDLLYATLNEYMKPNKAVSDEEKQ